MFRNRKQMGRWIAITVTIGLACSAEAMAGKPPKLAYSVIRLDDAGGTFVYGYPYDINNLGQIVGFVDEGPPSRDRHAAYWEISTSGGEIQSTLNVLSAGIAAKGINDLGETVGQGRDVDGRLVGMYWAGPRADPVVLPPLPGHDRSLAHAINDDGVICGASVIVGVGPFRAVAWRINWIDGDPVVSEPVELPGPEDGSSACAINNNDADGYARIVGRFGFGDPTAAAAWTVQSSFDDGALTIVDTSIIEEGLATGFAVNDGGTICGERDDHAVVWGGGSSQLLNEPKKGVALSHAYDVNDHGVIVGIAGLGLGGAHAAVWPSASDEMVYLDDFLGRNSLFTALFYAEAVNDLGEIVGQGDEGAFVAVPE